MAERKRVLVVGGSGYLGQHLLHELATADGGRPYELAFTHHRSAPPPELVDAISPVLCFRVDLRTGEGFDSVSSTFGMPHIVVNCAALSIPRTCEVDPAAAMTTNMPTSLVNWLSNFRNNDILLVHLSTDQVYEGIKSFYKEDDVTAPVNMYGKSKVAAEQLILAGCSNFIVLRSSIIYGTQTISPVTKSLPIQWIDKVLSCGEEVEVFHDEFRCPIYVKDVVNVILALMKKWISDGQQMKLIMNVGGPDRLSRAQMAEAIADFRGYDCLLIKPVSASSIDRGVASPADISMDISRLIRVLGIIPIPFRDGLAVGAWTLRRRGRARRMSAESPPEWLPDGWIMGIRKTRQGKREYYTSAADGCTFQSKEEVLNYLGVEKNESCMSDVAFCSNENKNEGPFIIFLIAAIVLVVSNFSVSSAFYLIVDVIPCPLQFIQCYFDPFTRSRFYSKNEVLRFLKSRKVPRKTSKMKKDNKKNSIDNYYIDPVNGYVFNSLKDAIRYVETGCVSKHVYRRKRAIREMYSVKESSPVSPTTLIS
ncbi:hypothetical protein AXF42_Ash009941 [Apostasia shenzhenica]|uniref:MBD domain-containing protein n=1 Tax=Apostasia shenzhenica TaxID=1088818 RepID=A0A2I0ACC9_9ASPA|nr:hypothetical protein AXF42_Ash009941 [Apostasia shenzhenica]